MNILSRGETLVAIESGDIRERARVAAEDGLTSSLMLS